VSIVQTGGIAGFCGKLSNMDPKSNDVLTAKIDRYIDIATDITALVFGAGSDEDDEKRRKIRQERCSGILG
jgi:hypothetical protein